MTVSTRSRWLKRLGVGTLALVGLGAVLLPSAPADARVFVSFGAPGYAYAPPPAYYPGYYGYSPYYGYPYGGGVYFGFGDGGWHHHWR